MTSRTIARLLRKRREPAATAIVVNRGNGRMETVYVREPVRERHAPHIAALVARRRARKARGIA